MTFHEVNVTLRIICGRGKRRRVNNEEQLIKKQHRLRYARPACMITLKRGEDLLDVTDIDDREPHYLICQPHYPIWEKEE